MKVFLGDKDPYFKRATSTLRKYFQLPNFLILNSLIKHHLNVNLPFSSFLCYNNIINSY